MSVRIGLGVPQHWESGPAAFFRWVDMCEGGDIDSLWISDRLIARQPMLEPMSTLAMIAGRTSRIKFGMNAVVLPFRDPFVLARECASLDYLSGGRLLPVFGVGAEISPEWRALGRSPAGRGRYANEMLILMQRLWTEEKVTFDGEFFQYKDASVAPKPKQDPMPVWIGGSSKAAIQRTAKLGNGWLGGLQTPAQVKPVVEAIRVASTGAGRPLDDDHYGAGFPFRFGSWDDAPVQQTLAGYSRLAGIDPLELAAVGGVDAIIARIDEFRAAGISKFVLRPIGSSDEDVADQTQRLIEEVVPVIHS